MNGRLYNPNEPQPLRALAKIWTEREKRLTELGVSQDLIRELEQAWYAGASCALELVGMATEHSEGPEQFAGVLAGLVLETHTTLKRLTAWSEMRKKAREG